MPVRRPVAGRAAPPDRRVEMSVCCADDASRGVDGRRDVCPGYRYVARLLSAARLSPAFGREGRHLGVGGAASRRAFRAAGVDPAAARRPAAAAAVLLLPR